MNKFSKFLKHGKRLVAIMLVLFMNINSFATTTSNDGSAFVTKAEFDSLINNFNNQMDTYQSGLNAKIDTAIASYLGGLSGTTSINEIVAYFKVIPSTVTTITMQPSSAYPYVKHNPYVTAKMVYGSTFYDQWNFYQFVGDASVTYTGNTSGKRRFVEQDGNIYRWKGYVTNYNEKFDISWNAMKSTTDTGFSAGNIYLHVLGETILSETQTTKNPNFTNLRWNLGDGNNHGVFTATNCTVDTTWPTSFNYDNQYDLIYKDAETSDQTADKMRFFIYSNPNNLFFRGCNSTYLQVMQGSSKSGFGRFKRQSRSAMADYEVSNQSLSSTIDQDGSSSYAGVPFFSCGYENITKWASVMTPDKTTYTYTNGTSVVPTTLQNYSMIGGAAFIVAEKDAKYTWDVEFTDKTSDSTIWLKYDPFDGEPLSDTCIKVSVDGGPLYNSGTIKEGKGTVTFTAEKNGMLFLKWSEGKTIDINKSKKITGQK